MSHPRIFISYSRADEVWKDRLVRHLRVLELEGEVELWDDSRLQAGDAWRPAIEQAMDAAVLLVSADLEFLEGVLRKRSD